jgi:hypothetical protein
MRNLSFAGRPSREQNNAARLLLAGVIRAFLFWNTGSLHTFREEDGLFAYHQGVGAGERFCASMEEIGILVSAARRGYRVTLRSDAIDAYASFLVDAGLDIEKIVRAFVVLMVDGVLTLFPEGKEQFEAKFYDNGDGTASFDTRQMLIALVALGYAKEDSDKYVWTARMRRTISSAWKL